MNLADEKKAMTHPIYQTAMTSQITRAYQIADRFRRLGVKVIIGGIHAWIYRSPDYKAFIMALSFSISLHSCPSARGSRLSRFNSAENILRKKLT